MILERPHFVADDPILDASGRTIGILFVGVEKANHLGAVHSLLRSMKICTVAILLVVGGVVFLGPLSARNVRTARTTNDPPRVSTSGHRTRIVASRAERDELALNRPAARSVRYGLETALASDSPSA